MWIHITLRIPIIDLKYLKYLCSECDLSTGIDIL